jgi:tetratricopeptide (TPR) repeat protein
VSSTKWDWRGILPYLPPREKRVLWALGGILGAAILLAFWAWQRRNTYDHLLVPLFFQQEEIAPIRTDTVGYRPITVEVPLRWGFGVHVGEVIVPPTWAVILGAVLIGLGWAALLTAVTRMQGFLPYLIYFAWAAWVFMAEAASTWAGVDPFYVVSLGITLVGVLPAYLGQSGLWRRSMGSTFGLLVAVIGGLFILPALWRREVSLPVLLQPWIAYPALILFLGVLVGVLHGPLVAAAGWAYLQERTRGGPLLFLSGTALVILLSAGLFLLPPETAYALAVPIMLGLVALGFFFLQPYFPSVAGVFSQPAALPWAWSGIGLILSAGILYHAQSHEYMFLYRVGEISRLTLAIGLPLMSLYLGLNFWPLWKAKKGFYWDLTKSLRMGLAVYYFGLLALLTFFEARNDWPTAKIGLRLYASVRGDRALLSGNIDEALAWYQRAIIVVPEEAKTNYNLARLEARSLKDVERSTDRYEKAFAQKPLLPAASQASLIWLAGDRPVAAIQALQRYIQHAPPAAPAYNMLAYAFYRLGYLDSAAYYWKAAIAADPTDPLYYLNLALLYARHGKPTWAGKVLESLPLSGDLPEGLCDNLLYLRLLGYSVPGGVSCASSNAQWLGEATDTTLVSRFLQALQKGDFRLAENLAKYLAEQDPDRRSAVFRLLGLGFWKAGHARRAGETFLAAETPTDSLYAAYAYGDAGCLEASFQLASRLGALYASLEKPARREAAILLSAAGRLSEASFYAPPSEWQDLDYLRFAHLVHHTKNLNEAVILLRPFVDKGAPYDVPYISVAKMFLSYADTAGAIENIQAGIERSPSSVGLRLLWAQILSAQGKADSAKRLLDSARTYLRTLEDSLRWWEGYLSYLGQYGSSSDKRSAAEKALAVFPSLPAAHVVLAQMELDSGKVEAAYQRISEALDIDPYVAELWRLYERVAAAMGLSEEVDLARKKPDPCPSAL